MIKWQIEGTDWMEVAENLEQESRVSKNYEDHMAMGLIMNKPDTPWFDNLTAAAKELNIYEDQLSYEICTYANRNSFIHPGVYHSEVSHLINNCEWMELSVNTIRDLKMLNDHYQDRPQEQLHMRRCIKELQKEWFEWVKEINGKILFEKSDKARTKEQKMIEKFEAIELTKASLQAHDLNGP